MGQGQTAEDPPLARVTERAGKDKTGAQRQGRTAQARRREWQW